MRFIKRILERGTITVPRDVREALGVDQGDIVEFEIVSIVRKGEGNQMTTTDMDSNDSSDEPIRIRARVSGGVPQ